MSNQISLTIPNDDPIALRAFGNALEEMAVAHGAELRKTVKVSDLELQYNVVRPLAQGITEPLRPYQQAVLDTGAEGEFVPFTDPEGPTIQDLIDDGTLPAPDYNLDADGLPWDARIHSGNQERNSDNTWRVRRRPKDLTPEQWVEQVAQVRDELFALMAIPVADPVVDDECPGDSTCTDQGCPHHYADESPAAVFGAVQPAPESIPVAEIVTISEHPVVVEQSSGGLSLGFNIQCEPLPAPPIADPVPPAPAPLPPVADPVPQHLHGLAPLPTVTAAADVPATLAELMTWLTSKAPSDEAGRAARLEQINGIVARHGLVTLSQLQKRLDLIPQVYADLVKELGQ